LKANGGTRACHWKGLVVEGKRGWRHDLGKCRKASQKGNVRKSPITGSRWKRKVWRKGPGGEKRKRNWDGITRLYSRKIEETGDCCRIERPNKGREVPVGLGRHLNGNVCKKGENIGRTGGQGREGEKRWTGKQGRSLVRRKKGGKCG